MKLTANEVVGSFYDVKPKSQGSKPIYLDPFENAYIKVPTYESSNGSVRFAPSGKIAGYDLRDMRTADDLYGLMPQADYERNVALAIHAINFRNDPRNSALKLLEWSLDICFKVRGKGGKMYYYKRHALENGLLDGKMTHCISFWEDISYISQRQLNYWNVSGPNTEFFDFEIPEISSYQDLLSNKEVEVLRLLARGFTSLDISRALKISKHTVNTHRRNMLRKLEVANTAEMLMTAKDLGLSNEST